MVHCSKDIVLSSSVLEEKDQLNGLLLIDFVSYLMLEPLEPHLGIVDMHTPFKFSSDMALEAPILATMNEWLRHAPK